MEVKYLWGICDDEYGFGNRSKILWLESFTHVSESTPEDFFKFYVVVHVLCPWTTLLFIDRVLCDRPCALPMDDSFAHRQSIWTFGSRHLDDPWRTWDVIFTIPSLLYIFFRSATFTIFFTTNPRCRHQNFMIYSQPSDCSW